MTDSTDTLDLTETLDASRVEVTMMSGETVTYERVLLVRDYDGVPRYVSAIEQPGVQVIIPFSNTQAIRFYD